MLLSDFDYALPEALIAQTPLPDRSASRMLVLPRAGGAPEHRSFHDFAGYFAPGDCLVLNDTRVIPARLFGTKPETGGRVEALLIEALGDGAWSALLRPGRRLRPGTRVRVDGADAAYTIEAKSADGIFTIRFDTAAVLDLLEHAGRIPLPPYIHREPEAADRERYQTVYARERGAVAAPTAGLHVTDALLAELRGRGVAVAYLTLHVGLGTFLPVSADTVEDHTMHAETYILPEACAATVNATRARGGRVTAVGTTSVRVLETCSDDHGQVTPGAGRTRLFMHPPMQPRCVDRLLTNFHLPKSTLLMLVSTFVGRERMLAAYADAVKEQYRFFSYGDCMFLV